MDTYTELDLAQEGTAITGTVSECGALSGCTTSSEVTGTVLFQHVVLKWVGETLDVTLAATADRLSNDTTMPFFRRTWR